jgi:hypothetical protein
MTALAPTTPLRLNAMLNEDYPSGVRFNAYQSPMDAEVLSRAVGSAVAYKRKLVTYTPSVNHSPELVSGGATNSFSRTSYVS